MKKTIIFLSALILMTGFSQCRFTEDRPVLEQPDGNKDRRRKILLSGSQDKPKYWLYGVTVVDTDFEKWPMGLFEGVIMDNTPAGVFLFTRDKLKFVDIMNRQFLKKPRLAVQAATKVIQEWDIKHSEYRLREVDGYTINQEEEDKYKSWDEKRFFTIDWSKGKILQNKLEYFETCWINKDSKTIDGSREVTEDYISFVVSVTYELKPRCAGSRERDSSDFTGSIQFRHSFKRVSNPLLEDKEYPSYTYKGEDDPLFRKYGYFTTIRQDVGQLNENKRVFYMNRWNPNKKHTFHFSKTYPEKYKYLAHGVICHINKLFREHKLNNYPLNPECTEDGLVLPAKGETCTKGICFELKNNTGQELGDIRYSFFHLIEEWKVGSLGYGPHRTNPATGEIFSGNVYIFTGWLDWFLKYKVHEIKKKSSKKIYDKNTFEDSPRVDNKTKWETSPFFINMAETLEEKNPEKWTDTSKGIDVKIRNDFDFLLSKLTFYTPPKSSFSTEKEDYISKIQHLIEDEFAHISLQGTKKKSEELNSHIEEYFVQNQIREKENIIYPIEPILVQFYKMLANGIMKAEDAKKRILFNLTTHEFGHVLNLTHNFYGSVDSKHFRKDKEERTILASSSIMDYIDMTDQAEGGLPRSQFGAYDEAALVYAYSMDNEYFHEMTKEEHKDLSEIKETIYLYCTHGQLSNFLCNAWDKGSTPSEVMMSFIEQYDDYYFIRNFRLDRDYWGDLRIRKYIGDILGTMFIVKQILPFWQTFNKGKISDTLKTHASYTEEEINRISHHLEEDVQQAIKLSIAFYSSILRIKHNERSVINVYDTHDSSLEQIGIFWDMYFSMIFLLGDIGRPHDPNHFLYSSSYIKYINNLPYRQMIEEVLEDVLTYRPYTALEVKGFIGIALRIYVESARGYYVLRDGGRSILEKVGVSCYTSKGLMDHFGINPLQTDQFSDNNLAHVSRGRLDAAILNMEPYLDTIIDRYYSTNEKLGIVFYNDRYYIASSDRNKYAFSMIKHIMAAAGTSYVDILKDNLQMMYRLYQEQIQGTDNIECNEGN